MSVNLNATEQTCWRFCCRRSGGIIVFHYSPLSPLVLELSLLQVIEITIGFPFHILMPYKIQFCMPEVATSPQI
jgi:hypothetical protein